MADYSQGGIAFVLFFGIFGLVAIICLIVVLSAPEQPKIEENKKLKLTAKFLTSTAPIGMFLA